MTRFIDAYNEYIKKGGDGIAVVGGGLTLTYNELDEAAGKIYAYLKDKGIGKEDFVQIVLPRGAKIVVAVTGVIKAAAAFMLLEDTYPDKRVEFIYKDCNCKLRIDERLYDEIMDTYKSLAGNETSDLHDAAYAVYTSGSTGNPKGVLHEYGNLDQTYRSGLTWFSTGLKRVCLYAPFNFIVGIMEYVGAVANVYTLYILPRELMRDFAGLKKYIADNKIEKIYMPPSLLRIYKEPDENLKVITTGSEPANGLSYGNSPYLMNVYSMSEAGIQIVSKLLDKPYDVAPVGKPTLEEIKVCLIDDNGNVIEGAGEGEICFANEYVRGYINLPKQTAKAFRDGIYHTNDLARRDENGDYYIVGRFDDMIKINGNRVEPAEVEAQIKKLTGLKRIVAKGFSKTDRSFIALYYINEEAELKGLTEGGELVFDKEELKKLLPNYMIPSYYVGLDDFPLTPTGKVSRRLLKEPEADEYKKEYVAPETDLEKKLCDIMQVVLNVDKVSVIDDFYAVGGDSMKAMMFVSECNEAGINMTTQALYDYRSPRELAKTCGKLVDEEEMARLNEEAMNKEWPLLPSQIANVIFGKRDEEYNSFNLLTFYRLRSDIDIKRLAKVTNKVLSAHKGMQIRIIKKDEGLFQKYDESFTPDFMIVEIDDKELRDNAKMIDKPYLLYKERMHRGCIYKTDEANYFYLSIHHIVSDGMSRKLILDQIAKAYNDDAFEIPKDYYYYMLSKRFEQRRSEKKLPEGSMAHLINFDKDEHGKQGAVVYRPNIAPIDSDRDGSFFVAALAMAVAKHNGRSDVRIKEVLAGRNELYMQHIAGELAVSANVDVEVTDDKTFEEIREEIRLQELYESAHPVTDFVVDRKKKSGLRFNYQKNTMEQGEFDKLTEENLLEEIRSTEIRGTASLNIIETGKKDTVDAFMAFAEFKYNRESIEDVMDIFEEIVKANL
ncbi:MAG: AMP-binding protein [Lachnospiraceae bacterium]|nr:AMP-binding protein [Lachnospiraceae bacterium]